MERAEFRERLNGGPMLLDGAMGTALHGKGIALDQCFDAVNRDDPAVVAQIHRGYIEAGADIIETNSFGANRFKLARHGLESETIALNQAAVSVARRVIDGSFKEVLLAGSIGPLGARLAPLGRVRASQARAAFSEQIGALLSVPEGSPSSAGVDLIILETMSDPREVEAAVEATRSLAPDVPIVSMMTFTRDDRTVLGDTPADVAAFLSGLDVDAIGVNCSGGPVQILRLLSRMREVAPRVPLAAAPNAGWPQQQKAGRVLYPATPEYFAQYALSFVEAGVSLIGGCCGTTAEHIMAMRQTLDNPATGVHQSVHVVTTDVVKPVLTSADRPTQLALALGLNRFVVTVEMSPPRGVGAQRLLAGARMLREAGAEFINVADSPLARMRMSAWAAAHLVQREVGLEAVLHFPTRGRNLLRVQGDLLAAHTLGIRNLFVVMGDPTQIGDYPEAMDDYDIVPTGLIQLIKERLNTGLDHAGRTIDQPTGFVVGCAVNLAPSDRQRELKLLHKKIRNGADFVVSQPVFDPVAAKEFIAAYEAAYGEAPVPIIAGIQPLYNRGNTEFLHNEVPGISIPDRLRKRMQAAADPQQEGVVIARELLRDLRPIVQGAYVIPVFGRYDLVADVLDELSEN